MPAIAKTNPASLLPHTPPANHKALAAKLALINARRREKVRNDIAAKVRWAALGLPKLRVDNEASDFALWPRMFGNEMIDVCLRMGIEDADAIAGFVVRDYAHFITTDLKIMLQHPAFPATPQELNRAIAKAKRAGHEPLTHETHSRAHDYLTKKRERAANRASDAAAKTSKDENAAPTSRGGFRATVYRILIASPSDIQADRAVIREAVYDWNDLNAAARSIVLLPLMWETHSRPTRGGRPQSILNEQVVDDADAVIAAFKMRFGSSTGKAGSGTLEEMERCAERGIDVAVYFSQEGVPFDQLDPKQIKKLKDFKRKEKEIGLVGEYTDHADLKHKIGRHLTRLVNELGPRAVSQVHPATTHTS